MLWYGVSTTLVQCAGVGFVVLLRVQYGVVDALSWLSINTPKLQYIHGGINNGVGYVLRPSQLYPR